MTPRTIDEEVRCREAQRAAVPVQGEGAAAPRRRAWPAPAPRAGTSSSAISSTSSPSAAQARRLLRGLGRGQDAMEVRSRRAGAAGSPRSAERREGPRERGFVRARGLEHEQDARRRGGVRRRREPGGARRASRAHSASRAARAAAAASTASAGSSPPQYTQRGWAAATGRAQCGQVAPPAAIRR